MNQCLKEFLIIAQKHYLMTPFLYVQITLMFLNNWFDDGTGSRFMPDEIVDDQYDPKGLNKKKGI